MKNLIGLIAFISVITSSANAQLPVNFSATSGWKYYLNTSGVPTSPPNTGGFDWKSIHYNTTDTYWVNSASAPLGYSSSGASYGSYATTTNINGSYTGSNIKTSYYRHSSINDPNLQSYTSLSLNVKRDDGIIVYLNEIEVYRDNIPTGTVSPATKAIGYVGSAGIDQYDSDENISGPITISGTLLASVLSKYPLDPTKLTITAEVHQWDPTDGLFTASSDSFFDLSLSGTLGPLTPLINRGPYLQLPTPFGMQVRWSTNTSEIGKVCYSDLGPISPSNPGTCQTQTITTPTTDHIVDITGLSNSQKYYYSIQHFSSSLKEESAEHFFITPTYFENPNQTTRIWVTGDCSEKSTYDPDYTLKQAAVLSGFENFKTANGIPKADLWLLLGDNAYDFGTNAEYGTNFFDKYDNLSTTHIMKQTPIMPCAGNHDYYGGSPISTGVKSILNTNHVFTTLGGITVSDLFGATYDGSTTLAISDFRLTKNNAFYDVFSQPTATLPKYNVSTTSYKKSYYSYNHNNIHFVCLDSYGFYNNYLLYGDIHDYPIPPNSSTNQQFDWLISDLNAAKLDPDIKWTILYWHHSPYTKGGGHDSDLTTADELILVGIREKLIKYLDESNYKIDLILNGHSHSYERSKLLKGHYNIESWYNASTNNNPLLPTNSIPSNANSSGKYTSSSDCPYIKNQSNPANEGIIYVVTGSAGEVQRKSTPARIPIGHSALNGASFPANAIPGLVNGTIQDVLGGSFYIEIKDNRLDAKFIDETGTVGDQFSIFKDVNSPTVSVRNITAEDYPSDSPSSVFLGGPRNWGAFSSVRLSGPTISGYQNFSSVPGFFAPVTTVLTPNIGPTYTISDAYGCLNQKFRFHFDENYCWPSITVNNLIDSPVPEKIGSYGIITSGASISASSRVAFEAVNNVLLTPVFNSATGAIFRAAINPLLTCPIANP